MIMTLSVTELNGPLLFFFLFVLLFIWAYKAWVISPPCPHPLPYHPLHPLPLPPTPSIPGRNYFVNGPLLMTVCHMFHGHTLLVLSSKLSLCVANFMYFLWPWIFLWINQIWPLQILKFAHGTSEILCPLLALLLLSLWSDLTWIILFHFHLCVFKDESTHTPLHHFSWSCLCWFLSLGISEWVG
jgi:hypothetical protein